MKTLEELKAIRDRVQSQIEVRNENGSQMRVVVGMATCGIASGARPVLNTIADAVRDKNLKDIVVTQTGCIGLCQLEPLVEIYETGKEKVTYIKMNPEKAKEVVEQHLIRGLIVSKYTVDSTEL